MSKIDWTKPVQSVAGYPVEIVSNNVRLVECLGIKYVVHADGSYHEVRNWMNTKYFENVPEKKQRFQNQYKYCDNCAWYLSREQADEMAYKASGRIAVLIETEIDGVYTYERVKV